MQKIYLTFILRALNSIEYPRTFYFRALRGKIADWTNWFIKDGIPGHTEGIVKKLASELTGSFELQNSGSVRTDHHQFGFLMIHSGRFHQGLGEN